MKKEDLSNKIRRRLGEPLIKVELDPLQIYDAIDYAINKYRKWATSNATIEKYITLLLIGGETLYDLPEGTNDVLGYNFKGTTGSINTLFTVDNYMYMNGMYDQLLMRGGVNGYGMVSLHIAKDFLETVNRYIVDSYNFTYHKYSNQLEISPAPPISGATTVVSAGEYVENTPGYILLRTFVDEGTDEDLYSNNWILDYATAMCKLTLGRIRLKFAGFSAVGSNVGLSLDGDALINEGTSEIDKLEETLRNEENEEGYPILIG